MPSDTIAIEVERLSKLYHAFDTPAARLRHLLTPKAPISVPARISQRWRRSGRAREYWALRDINFEVRKGEAFGVIGRNGSGKSTLLQIIAGTLQPTEGVARVRGRVAALLELGSGFNPEFTGRENILINGLIVGLTEKQILDKFDDIAAFADIGEFLDQPLKTYSSGMMLRLAFAVQTQVDPDIMIVDEALAVGDALFQKRCFQQLKRLRDAGCTLLLVSHDEETIRTQADRAILLRDGAMRMYGASADVILEYRRESHADEGDYYRKLAGEGAGKCQTATEAGQGVDAEPAREPEKGKSFGDRKCEISRVTVLDGFGENAAYFHPGDMMVIRVDVAVHADMSHLNVNLRIRNKEGVKMYSWGTLNQDIAHWAVEPHAPGFWHRRFSAGERFQLEFAFLCSLGMNFYEVQASVTEELDQYYADQRMLHWLDEAAFFQVGMRPREYRFGGVADLKMEVRLNG